MSTTDEYSTRDQTDAALQTLANWGKEPGLNITFALVRQGSVADQFFSWGVCVWTAGGNRGSLRGTSNGDSGDPKAYFPDFSTSPPTLQSVPFTFELDLNSGSVSLSGGFPNLPAGLEFAVRFLKSFENAQIGRGDMVFYPETTSDNSGYILCVERTPAFG